MPLRVKFSLLLSFLAAGSVFVTAYFLANSFVEDQEAYLNDLQTSVAVAVAQQVQTRMDLLYGQLDGVVRDGHYQLQAIIPQIAGCLSGEERLAPQGNAPRWSLRPSSLRDKEGRSAVNWVGRFGTKEISLHLRDKWFEGIFDASHGLKARLVQGDGRLLLGPSDGDLSREAGALKGALETPPGIARTERFVAADGRGYLGTFLRLDTSPPLVVAITTPRSAVEAVIAHSYQKSALISLVSVLVAILLALLYAASLTSPLQAFTREMKSVAKGREEPVDIGRGRRDEVGILARAFNEMIAELKRARVELRRTERLAALGKFSAGIAHEIKNPLSSILGNTQAVKRLLSRPTPPSPASVNEALSFVEEETLRANQIVSQLLKFARQDKPPESETDLVERLKRSVSILHAQVEAAGVTEKIRFASARLVCRANADQIHEVFSNLVLNALHAMKDRPRKELTVEVKETGGRAWITVGDTGHGMDKAVMEQIFEPFFTTKPSGQGTGLGLAVCHGIVQNHRGEIKVESAPGVGTRFHIILPLAQSQTGEAHAA